MQDPSTGAFVVQNAVSYRKLFARMPHRGEKWSAGVGAAPREHTGSETLWNLVPDPSGVDPSEFSRVWADHLAEGTRSARSSGAGLGQGDAKGEAKVGAKQSGLDAKAADKAKKAAEAAAKAAAKAAEVEAKAAAKAAEAEARAAAKAADAEAKAVAKAVAKAKRPGGAAAGGSGAGGDVAAVDEKKSATKALFKRRSGSADDVLESTGKSPAKGRPKGP